MICVAVTYNFRPGREDEAAEHLRRLIPASRAEPGCRTYVVHRSEDDPRTFLIYEQYDDRAAFDAHRASAHFQQHGRNGIQPLADKRVAVIGSPLDFET